MVHTKKFKLLPGSLFGIIIFILLACNTSKKLSPISDNITSEKIEIKRSSGGSSGMEQLSDSSYLVIYDIKIHRSGSRLGLINVNDDTIIVSPIKVDSWDVEGIANDLESVCAIPNRDNEFLLAESGNWQGNLGRIFHIHIDFKNHKATVLATFKIPLLHINDFSTTGDQYEAIFCLPYTDKERIVIIGERGGSQFSPMAILRWGIWNIENKSLTIEGNGLKGVEVSAPGNWANNQMKRSITDVHVDNDGIIWASASEDRGDTGPFYSVIYKLGETNEKDLKKPIIIYDKLKIGREIYGFKIEALSGPQKGIDCTHTFGTEDEIYGGVWRPINIVSSK